jgi:hypothetical protein
LKTYSKQANIPDSVKAWYLQELKDVRSRHFTEEVIRNIEKLNDYRQMKSWTRNLSSAISISNQTWNSRLITALILKLA